MTRSNEERLLAFLEGTLPADERERLLADVEASPELAESLRRAAAGMEAALDLAAHPVPSADADGGATRAGRRVSPWWLVASSAATLAIAVPVTLALAGGGSEGTAATGPTLDPAAFATGQPIAPEPSFVLVLHGLWPDAGDIEPAETRRRAREYWAWTNQLAREGTLMAAGDLRWEPGARLGPGAAPLPVAETDVADPGFLVGMFALRVSTYEEALAVARACPHLRYGGSVSVRQVGGGFVTVPGRGDGSG